MKRFRLVGRCSTASTSGLDQVHELEMLAHTDARALAEEYGMLTKVQDLIALACMSELDAITANVSFCPKF